MEAYRDPSTLEKTLFSPQAKSLAQFCGRGVHISFFFLANFSAFFSAFFSRVIFPEFFRTHMFHNLGDSKKRQEFLIQRSPVGLNIFSGV